MSVESRMTPAVRTRVEGAILTALAGGPLTGVELAERLRALPGCLTDAAGWPLLLPALRSAGRVRRVGFGSATRWVSAGRRRRPAGGPASATPTRAA